MGLCEADTVRADVLIAHAPTLRSLWQRFVDSDGARHLARRSVWQGVHKPAGRGTARSTGGLRQTV